jgi:TrmH family RNA methyltransferase
MPRITSSHNPRFREALGLREGRERRRRELILIDGMREIERALDAGVRPVQVFVDLEAADGAGDERPQRLADRAVAGGAELVDVSDRLLGRLAYGDRDVGIVLVAATPTAALADLTIPDEPLFAVVEGVEKPGNLGAVLRTADAGGLSGVVVADPRTDLFNPNVIRASLGTVFSMPIAVASTTEAIAWLGEAGIRVVAARVDAAIEYSDADLTGRLAIAVGSEARGLSDDWNEPAATPVRIPMRGAADSLNVSATAAILFYEALRQRRRGAG